METLVTKNKEKLLKLDQMTDGAPGTDHLGFFCERGKGWVNVIPNKEYYGVIVCLESTHPASLASVFMVFEEVSGSLGFIRYMFTFQTHYH